MSAILIPIVAIAVPCVVAFGIVYIIYTARHRERMEMISRGLDPDANQPVRDPKKALRSGLQTLGVGLGLLAGWIYKVAIPVGPDPERSDIVYLIGILVFVGLAEIVYFLRFRTRTAD